jgi:hypothetical protein
MQNPNNLEGKADLSLIYNVNARLVHMKSRHITCSAEPVPLEQIFTAFGSTPRFQPHLCFLFPPSRDATQLQRLIENTFLLLKLMPETDQQRGI